MDVGQLQAIIEEKGVEKIAFVRMEAGANLIGGQPFSLANLRQVKEICKSYGLCLFRC